MFRALLRAAGSRSGSGGQVTHRVAAVHRLVLWAGGLSTAGVFNDAAQFQQHPPENFKNYSQIPLTNQIVKLKA